MSGLPAARLGDSVAHTDAAFGFAVGGVMGLAVGLALIAAIPTGGLSLGLLAAVGGAVALTGGAALGGMRIGQEFGHTAGDIVTGSPTVIINGRPAARALGDTAVCDGHAGPQEIATGSETVIFNGMPAARLTDLTICDARISSASGDVIIGGPTGQFAAIGAEVSPVLTTIARDMVIGGTIVALGAGGAAAYGAAGWAGLGTFGLQAGGGFAGSVAGATGLGALGQAVDGSRGRAIGEVVGGFGGGFGGAMGGTAAAGRLGLTGAGASGAADEGLFTPKGARGPNSGRDFDPEQAGGPIAPKSLDDVNITHDGVDQVEAHVGRFGEDGPNQAMIARQRAIADGTLEPTIEDKAFHAHELDEFQRYKNQGFERGLPDDPEAQAELWNNTHTAALEDYGMSEVARDPVTGQVRSTLYHPSCDPRLVPPDWTPPPGYPFND